MNVPQQAAPTHGQVVHPQIPEGPPPWGVTPEVHPRPPPWWQGPWPPGQPPPWLRPPWFGPIDWRTTEEAWWWWGMGWQWRQFVASRNPWNWWLAWQRPGAPDPWLGWVRLGWVVPQGWWPSSCRGCQAGWPFDGNLRHIGPMQAPSANRWDCNQVKWLGASGLSTEPPALPNYLGAGAQPSSAVTRNVALRRGQPWPGQQVKPQDRQRSYPRWVG